MPFTQIHGIQIADGSITTADLAENNISASVLNDNSLADAKIISVSAAKVTLADVEDKYSSTTVEGALLEMAIRETNDIAQVNQNILTSKTDTENKLAAEVAKLNTSISDMSNTVTVNIQGQINSLGSSKAALGGEVNQNFSANNLTVKGNILPTGNGIQDIGSSANRFGTIWVNEAKLATNTLYIGDTPVLGTNQDTIIIKADNNQSLTMSTKGTGLTTVTSETGVTLSTTGMNADVKIQASGTGANVRMTAAREVSLQAPNVNVTGDTAITGSLSVNGLTVNGNLTVKGTLADVQVQTMQVQDNIIEVNRGELGAGVTAGQAGLKVDRGDAADYYFVFDESDDMFKVGMVGQLETLASQNWVNAHMYVHPTTHPASIIVEEADKRFLKDTERSKIANTRQNQAGQAYFAGMNNYVTVTLPIPTSDANYFVAVTPAEATNGNLGEMWVDKMAGSFRVYNTGSATNKFDWMVMY